MIFHLAASHRSSSSAASTPAVYGLIHDPEFVGCSSGRKSNQIAEISQPSGYLQFPDSLLPDRCWLDLSEFMFHCCTVTKFPNTMPSPAQRQDLFPNRTWSSIKKKTPTHSSLSTIPYSRENQHIRFRPCLRYQSRRSLRSSSILIQHIISIWSSSVESSLTLSSCSSSHSFVTTAS